MLWEYPGEYPLTPQERDRDTYSTRTSVRRHLCAIRRGVREGIGGQIEDDN